MFMLLLHRFIHFCQLNLGINFFFKKQLFIAYMKLPTKGSDSLT